MKVKVSVMIVLTIWVAFLSGCGSSEQAKSMEQIYSEEGVPVKVQEVKQQDFESKLTYNAVLTGIEESSEYAMIADKVDQIHFKVGDYVEKGEVVISFPTDNPGAKYYQSKVSYENALATYNRYKNIFDSGGIARQDLDNAKTSLDVAKANWDAVMQSVSVRAPISGRISKINVRESDNVQVDDELFTVTNIDRMKAKIWVAEKDITNFEKGIPARAKWNSAVLDGRVVQVDMSIDSEHQGFGVTVEFENPGLIKQTGITAQIEVDVYSQTQSIVIERKDVITRENRNYVFLLSDSRALRQEVTLGASHELDVEIISGLNTGDSLIIEGQLLLDDGVKVRPVEGQPVLSAEADQDE